MPIGSACLTGSGKLASGMHGAEAVVTFMREETGIQLSAPRGRKGAGSMRSLLAITAFAFITLPAGAPVDAVSREAPAEETRPIDLVICLDLSAFPGGYPGHHRCGDALWQHSPG